MPLSASRLIRRMRGGAQAQLVEADDGQYYVVKFLNNPQHRRILINELIVSSFFRYLQLAVPQSAIIRISEAFLAEYPDAHLQLGSRTVTASPGWHFGSCFPGDPARQAVYDFLPDTLLRQLANGTHFLGALVVDKWVANADARQAIYFRARIGAWMASGQASPRKTGFVASMIDHGFAFGGPNWDFQDGPLQGLAPRPVVYETVKNLDDFQPWLDQVVHFPEAVLDEARRQVPPQWFDGDEALLDDALERLVHRRRNVPALIDQCRRARAALFPNWK